VEADDKARIIEDPLAPGAVVSDIARRHGLTCERERAIFLDACRRGVVI
jgi:transposase-like protein